MGQVRSLSLTGTLRYAARPLPKSLGFQMGTFRFNGRVVDGGGLFRKQIGLPANLLSGYEEWMPEFVQGTLNIQFSIPELPSEFHGMGLRFLDLNENFPPKIYRAGSDIENNTIQPSSVNPRKGDLQLWQAFLFNQQTDTEHKCFLMRRVESGYRDKAEILGECNFREKCGFLNGHQVTVTVYVD